MERKGAKEKGFAGLFFMLGVMALYVVVFFLNEQLGRDALDHAGNLLSRLAPVLALVFVLIFLTNLLIRPAWVRTHVGQHSGWRGWAVAIFGGMLSVCVKGGFTALTGWTRTSLRTGWGAVHNSRSTRNPSGPLVRSNSESEKYPSSVSMPATNTTMPPMGPRKAISAPTS
ncbi:MAG: hypothetical protein P8Y83_07960, partial [Gammaproteobacteria bacterium]